MMAELRTCTCLLCLSPMRFYWEGDRMRITHHSLAPAHLNTQGGVLVFPCPAAPSLREMQRNLNRIKEEV